MVEKWEGWLVHMAKVCKKDIFSKMPKQNVFFFNAEGGQTDPKATTQADLLAWINDVSPDESAALLNKDLNLLNIVDSVQATGDRGLKEFMKAQMEEMKLQRDALND